MSAWMNYNNLDLLMAHHSESSTKKAPPIYWCDQKSRAACAQSFALWQQATTEIMRRYHSIIACSRHIYIGVILRAHPVRGESHIQRNAN